MRAPSEKSSLRVAVLAGGSSPEREVSLRSGAAVAKALAGAGHEVERIDPAQRDLIDIAWDHFDACFIALHGGAGEDGRVQQDLERLNVPYTGSGPQACRLAMSKSESKRRFVEFQVPTPHFALIAAHESAAEIAPRVAPLGYPLVVKPDNQGSSLGVTIVDSPRELSRGIAEAFQFDALAIAEPLVRGREFTVSVLDDRALPLVEIISPERVFSYEAKYQSSLTEYRFDFELGEAAQSAISQAALAAARSLGTCGLARVDVIVDHDGEVWVLEVNTVPGMTARSLAPQAAARAGLDLSALCDLLVRQCLATPSAT